MTSIVMILIGDIRYDGRVRKEISTLVSAGHNVELIVSDFQRESRGGEELGISIRYIPIKMRSTAAANFFEQIFFNIKASRLLSKLTPNFIHCHDLSALPAGVLGLKYGNTRLVFDAHELMPESMGGIKEKIWNMIEKYCIPYCDIILMPEKNRIKYFKKKYSGRLDIRLLENFPRRVDIPDCNKNYLRECYPIKEDQKIVLHTGAIAPGRYVEELIEAIQHCSNDIVLVLLGRTYKGYDKILRAKIDKLSLADRVFLHEPVPHSKMLDYMASSDIGTAFYRNTNLNNYYCASNKLYECIALSKPVITNNHPGLVDIVQKNKLGFCLTEVNPHSLSKAFEDAAALKGITPGSAVFYWEDTKDALLDIYRSS